MRISTINLYHVQELTEMKRRSTVLHLAERNLRKKNQDMQQR